MASPDAIIGTIELWPFDWAPYGWAICNGQKLNAFEYYELFSIIGPFYGYDFTANTFALPDLRGRVPLGAGASYRLGQQGGIEQRSLFIEEIPLHNHRTGGNRFYQNAMTGPGVFSNSPEMKYPAAVSAGNALYGTKGDITMAPVDVEITVTPTGQSRPVSFMQPYLVLNYIIKLTGIYPEFP